MYDPLNVYAYDIETMNDEESGYNGLDPARSFITEIAVATDPSVHGGGMVFAGEEGEVLLGFIEFVASLPSGLMANWNGTFFDNPFIARRASALGLPHLAPVLEPQAGLLPKYPPASSDMVSEVNPNGGWSACFSALRGTHASLDVSQGYHRYADENGVKWALKPVCVAQGIEMIELDRSRLHTYTQQERIDYNMSDSRGTRELALRMMGLDYYPYR